MKKISVVKLKSASTKLSMAEAKQLSESWQARSKENVFNNSAKQIKKDRER
jgi:ribosomal protein L7/L12